MPREDRDPDTLATEIHQCFWKRLVCFAYRRLADKGSAEDVAQETIRRVLEALRERRVENQDALPAFVFQTARNICMHHGRSARREQNALLKFTGNRPLATTEDSDAVADLLGQERIRALKLAIGQLDHSEEDLLMMLFVEALDNALIARRLSIEPGALRVRKHRLLKKLADLVKSAETKPPQREQTE